MVTDKYTKFLLTVIAVCLVAIVFQNTPFVASAVAGTSISCRGTLTANAWGGVKEMIGGYDVSINCN